MTELIESEHISNFLNTRLANYSSYDNLRKIASCIDGLKNASRKVLHTVHDLKIKNKVKVLQLSNECSKYADYLHGSLDGVVVTLGQNFSGTNNIPLLQKSGNFGTRSVPKASAPRYIFANGSKEFFTLFKYEDDDILEHQYFEGNKIEPRFFVPTLPLLLINGSEGISSGFAQKILGRKAENVKKCLINKLQGKPIRKDWLTPYYNDFNGSFESDPNTPNRWIIKGKIEKISNIVYLIKDIPFTYNLKSYLNVLDELQESKVISKYTDESNGENVLQFRVWFPRGTTITESEIYDKLKLVKPITENYTCIDENNKIKIFNNAEEILDYYIEVKKKYIQKRKDNIIEKLTFSINLLKSKMFFIKGYINNSITVVKVSEENLLKQLRSFSEILDYDNYNYILRMPISSLTKEKIQDLSEEIKSKTNDLNTLKKMTVNDIWISDLS